MRSLASFRKGKSKMMTPEEMYMRECALARVMGATNESRNYGWGATIEPPSVVKKKGTVSANVHLTAPSAVHLSTPSASHLSAPRGSIASHFSAPSHSSGSIASHFSAPSHPSGSIASHFSAPSPVHTSMMHLSPPTGIHPMAPTGRYIAPPTGRSYIAPPTGRYIAPPTGRYIAPPTERSYIAPPTGRFAPPPQSYSDGSSTIPLSHQYQPADDYVSQHHHRHHHPHMPPTEQPYYPDAEDVEPTYSQPQPSAYDAAPQGYDDSSVDSNEEVYDDSVQIDDGSDVGFGMHWAVPFGAGVVAHSLYLNRWY